MADCASRGFLHAAVLPLAGLGKDWSPVLAHEEEFHEGYPGYVTSKNGPRAKDQDLEDIQVHKRHLQGGFRQIIHLRSLL